jgi:Heterokaryon incompatibility protein (HET)
VQDCCCKLERLLCSAALIELVSSTLKELDGLDNSSTNSEATFKLARMWLTDCLSNHTACRKPSGFLPSRLIDVGPSDGSKNPFLQETSDLVRAGSGRQYVALSHCWGKQKFTTTVTTNLAAHKKNIPLENLPLTFRDAVEATQRMGVRYLWIDSLCIIQDSTEDWLNESTQMCQIYEEALFTITSAHASSAYGGMFVERDGIRSLPIEIALPFQRGKHSVLFLPMARPDKLWDRDQLPVYSRGWCLQELILSSRTLIFDPDGIRWECLAGHCTERSLTGGTERHSRPVRTLQNVINRNNTPTGDMFDLLGDDLSLRSMCWQSIVRDYTSRSLTQYSDKLIALAGVADAMQRRTSNQYLAGLWKDNLYTDLLWAVLHRDDAIAGQSTVAVHDPPPYRMPDSVAPSWSWASVNVRVEYQAPASTFPICKTIEACVTGPPNKQSGHVTIQGDIRKLYLLQNSTSHLTELKNVARSPKYQYKSQWGSMHTLFESSRTMLAATKPPGHFSRVQTLHVQWEPEEIVDEKTLVTFIAIAQQPHSPEAPLDLGRQVVYTLALVPATEGSKYRRVGWAAWQDCTWYGHSCADDRHLKADAYGRLSSSWGRIKPPILCGDGTHQHPIKGNPLVDEAAYHPDVKMKRTVVTIV